MSGQELPVGWEWATPPDLAENCDSRRVPLNGKEREGRKGAYPYYGANGQVGSINDFIFDGEYTLVAEDGGYFDDPARGVAYTAKGRFWVNNHAHVLRPLGGVSSTFLRHALNQVEWREYITGTTRAKLTQAALNAVKLPCPPLAEQRRIVEKVEALTARSRRAREALDALPALIDRYRQSILAAAFRGDLTAEWREVRGLKSNADQYIKQLQEERKGRLRTARRRETDMLELPEQLPASWSVVSLSAIAWASSYGTSEKCDANFAGPPVLRIPNVARGDLDLSALKRAQALCLEPGDEVAPGDFLIVRTNGSRDLLGRGTVVQSELPEPFSYASYLIRFRLVGGRALARWINLVWQAPQLRRLVEQIAASSAGQYNISMSELAAFPIPIPPPDEMEVICDRTESKLAGVTAVAEQNVLAYARLATLDQSILAKAFRGELVPQDPNDEPASVLLERIRAERAAAGDKPRRGRRKGAPHVAVEV